MFDSVKSRIRASVEGIQMPARVQVVPLLPSPLGFAGVQPATTCPLTSQLQFYLRAYFTDRSSIFMRHENNKSAQHVEQSCRVRDCRASRSTPEPLMWSTCTDTFHSTAWYYLYLKLALVGVEHISREASLALKHPLNGSMCTSVQTLNATQLHTNQFQLLLNWIIICAFISMLI